MNLALRPVVVGTVMGSLAVMPGLAVVFGEPFLLDLAMRAMCLAIAATSLNLILGFGGMISFGHAAFIGIGAYAVGIPAYYGITEGLIQIPIAVAAAALFAFLTGLVSLRTKGVHFIMITLAFAQMVFFAFVSIEEYGGDDGLVIDSRSTFAGIVDLEGTETLYYVIFVCLVGALYIVKRVSESRFGLVIQAARQNKDRIQAVGYDVFRYRLVCYVISGAICGLAGALLGNFTGFISPEMMDWTRSGELIFMVLLGGAGTPFGPLFGTFAFLFIEEILSSFTIYWPLLFGMLLIGVVLFTRGGVDGLLGRRRG